MTTESTYTAVNTCEQKIQICTSLQNISMSTGTDLLYPFCCIPGIKYCIVDASSLILTLPLLS